MRERFPLFFPRWPRAWGCSSITLPTAYTWLPLIRVPQIHPLCFSTCMTTEDSERLCVSGCSTSAQIAHKLHSLHAPAAAAAAAALLLKINMWVIYHFSKVLQPNLSHFCLDISVCLVCLSHPSLLFFSFFAPAWNQRKIYKCDQKKKSKTPLFFCLETMQWSDIVITHLNILAHIWNPL